MAKRNQKQTPMQQPSKMEQAIFFKYAFRLLFEDQSAEEVKVLREIISDLMDGRRVVIEYIPEKRK